jgi:hypothetical protein
LQAGGRRFDPGWLHSRKGLQVGDFHGSEVAADREGKKRSGTGSASRLCLRSAGRDRAARPLGPGGARGPKPDVHEVPRASPATQRAEAITVLERIDTTPAAMAAGCDGDGREHGPRGYELRRANEILKAASVFFATELDADRPK